MIVDPLYAFVFLGLFTPGPNIVLLTASGARFGFTATLPHLLGVVLGVGVVSGITGFGVSAALGSLPVVVATLLKFIAVGWMLYMAYGLWNASVISTSNHARPMNFIEAVLFQWVNPKVWAVAFAAVSAHPSSASMLGEALRVASAFSAINLAVCLFWTSTGTVLRYLLVTRTAWTLFTRSMATALAMFSIMIFV